MFLRILGVFLLFFGICGFADVGHAVAQAKIHTFTLKNGLRVVLAPDHRSPVVVHMVWYGVGAVDEPAGKTGIAHMLEHMMFKGTDTVPPGAFSKRIAQLGGQDNAFTSADYTAYYQKIGRDNLTQAVKLEADRIANLRITDTTFKPERNVILEERNMRVDSRPIPLFFEKFSKTHFPTHPYGNPVIGWRMDIENYTLKDAQNWYQQFYAPQNALVVLTGALDLDEARWLAEAYYGPLKNPAKKPVRPEIQPEALFTKAKRLTHEDPRAQLPLWVRRYRAPSLQQGVAGSAAPPPFYGAGLVLLAEVLGGGLTSTLYQHLVVEEELADAAQASYSPVGRYESDFQIIVQPKAGVEVAAVEKAVERVLAGFLKDGVPPEALERAKMQAKSADVFARDDLFEAAYRLGAWLVTGGTLKGYQEWLSTLSALTPEMVQKIAKEVLVAQQSTTGILLPASIVAE